MCLYSRHTQLSYSALLSQHQQHLSMSIPSILQYHLVWLRYNSVTHRTLGKDKGKGKIRHTVILIVTPSFHAGPLTVFR